MPARHPLARAMDWFVASAILILAVVSTLIWVDVDARMRNDGLERLLATTAMGAVQVLGEARLVDVTDSSQAPRLDDQVIGALEAISHQAGEEIGVSVLTESGGELWTLRRVARPALDSATSSPPIGEVRQYQVDGYHVAVTRGGLGDRIVVSFAPTAGPRVSAILVRNFGIFTLVGLLLFYAGGRVLDRRVLRPLAAAEGITRQVSTGDLRVESRVVANVGGGPLTESLQKMVSSLVQLVAEIRAAAHDSAAMAEEISASTEQMTASTEEVAATTGELTDRATHQAVLVRSVADDAERILAIAEHLAAGALQAAERNSALAALARRHRDDLGVGAATLDQLAEEAARGAEEAEVLARTAEAIEQFATQTSVIARQTHVLSLNAALEAARAGEGGQGFTVVAEEVKRLAGQTGQAAAQTRETVRRVVTSVNEARDRLLRLSQGGLVARETARAAAGGLGSVADQAEENDAWTHRISRSAEEVRGLIDEIATRTTELSAGTEEVAAAAGEIAAAAEQLNASTEEVAVTATRLADASVRLTGAVGTFRLE